MRKKVIRITTVDLSLDRLLKGQLRFLNQYFDIVGIADDSGMLKNVSEREGIRIIPVRMNRDISFKQDIKSLFLLINLFKREKPYIVHSNTPKASLLSMVAAWVVRVPHRIYTVTGLRYQGTVGFFRYLLKIMEVITCFCATKVIPEGNGVKETLIKDKITSKPLKVILNGNINGIDTNFFSVNSISKNKNEIRSLLNINISDFVFIYIGRIVKDKGINELVSAMKKMKMRYSQRCKLILVGCFESEFDPLLTRNEFFIRNDETVRYVGYQNDVRPYLLAADALVFPSYREGFPNVVMQAGAMGIPSIVTDINGCNEIIVEGKNGTIIPPKDIDALYHAMKKFLDNPSYIAELSSHAREMICSRYEQKKVWDALLKEYKYLDKN